MPEERRNPRRRIAGQRRTSDRREPLPDETTSDEATSDETAVDETAADETTVEIAEETPDAETEIAEAGDKVKAGRTTLDETDLPDETDVPAEADVPDEGADGDDAGTTDEVARRGGARLMAGVLGVLVVLTLTAAVVLGERAWRGHQAEEARSEASTAARRAAELVLSYDYRTLTKDFEASRATLTPEFAADFDQTTKVVAQQATKVKATVRAEVREVGVRDGDADRVTLLVFVNQTTTSTITQNKPRVDLNRARFTMVRIGGQWLVRSIEPL
ncbi:hypothetical protein OG394_31885 [Kribbella sp. NBC_01245]|uniref:hypothetical protein n=1 Tax=Kribbella sp. NBC_01245 TaxID=2903578 RepID=UPI002E2DCDDC|nr:hypothetical protein [Kribbella sp. NBC_01245]